MKKLILAAALLLGVAGFAAAEKADSYQKTVIDYGTLDADDVKQIYTFTGDVTLKRGTLLMKADKAVVTYTPDGYQVATLTGGGNRKVSFRQKRDGEGDQWMEGEAERMEYDERPNWSSCTPAPRSAAWKARSPATRWRANSSPTTAARNTSACAIRTRARTSRAPVAVPW